VKLKNSNINLILFHVISPLTAGGLIYIVFRTKSLRMFSWFESIGINTQISFLREYFSPLKYWLPSWVYFSLPDGLWVYSFTSIILILWAGKINFWLIIPFSFGILIEILQGLSFKGTFDYLDLAFSIIGISTSTIIINRKFKQNEKQKQFI
jgi:hypothetical protein